MGIIMKQLSTAAIAKAYGSIDGNKTYEQRARLILPALVRQAKAGKTITYGQIASEYNFPNARNLNYPLGTIGSVLESLEKKWGESIPKIQVVVVNKVTEIPGEGVADFLPDPETFKRASKKQKVRIVNFLLSDIFTYPKWDKVLQDLGLKPISSKMPIETRTQKTQKYKKGSVESNEHKKLKEYIATNPTIVGLPQKVSPGTLEYTFPSKDSIDILFKKNQEVIGIEVKSRISPSDDIERGLYQCVKYDALLDAIQKVEQSQKDVKVILALGRPFPFELRGLQNVLGVTVIDNIEIA